MLLWDELCSLGIPKVQSALFSIVNSVQKTKKREAYAVILTSYVAVGRFKTGFTDIILNGPLLLVSVSL